MNALKQTSFLQNLENTIQALRVHYNRFQTSTFHNSRNNKFLTVGAKQQRIEHLILRKGTR
jgi:hypothetical protein